jgi:Holliday junction DNA helicase RuvA
VIAEIRGNLTSKSGDLVTIMTAAGVGYEISVPVGTLGRLPRAGGDVQLHTTLVVREDSWSLFGFDRPSERVVFQRLLLANGVGPRLALAVISALGGDRVIRAVRNEDIAALCTVQGVGKKKAERMVLELKDRMGDLEVPDDVTGPGVTVGPGATGQQAVTALINLGYGQVESEDAVRTALAEGEPAGTADLIRLALEQVTGRR